MGREVGEPMSETLQQEMRERIRHELPHLAEAEAGELARLVERLVAAFRPVGIYLFGSQARGEPTPDSDFDLLVVVRESDQPSHRRAQAAYHALGRRALPVDVLVMTREEFDRRAPATASLPATVLREGKALYAA